jgi:hypothetical protein
MITGIVSFLFFVSFLYTLKCMAFKDKQPVNILILVTSILGSILCLLILGEI